MLNNFYDMKQKLKNNKVKWLIIKIKWKVKFYKNKLKRNKFKKKSLKNYFVNKNLIQNKKFFK